MAKVTNEANTDLFSKYNKAEQSNINYLVDSIIDAVDVTKAAKEEEDAYKAEFRALAKEEYWNLNFGRNINDSPVHVFDAKSSDVLVVQVNFVNKFTITPEQYEQLRQLFAGNKKLKEYIKTTREVKVDISNSTPEQQIAFMKELAVLSAKYDLDGVMTTQRTFSDDFHDARHDWLPAVNKQIDKIVPMQVHITTTTTEE